MAWTAGQRYRFRVVPSEVQVERIQNAKGTPMVVALLEVTAGPQIGQRLRWKGYVNNPDNAARTVAELRVMGWRGARLGEWSGLGSKEFEASAMPETGRDGKTYWSAAFPRDIPKVNVERAVHATELDELNGQLGGILTRSASDGPPLPPPPSQADDDEQESGELPF